MSKHFHQYLCARVSLLFQQQLQFLKCLLEEAFWNKSAKSSGRTTWDSLLQALVPLLPMDGDVAKAAMSEAGISETHRKLGMDFSGIHLSRWKKSLEGQGLLE